MQIITTHAVAENVGMATWHVMKMRVVQKYSDDADDGSFVQCLSVFTDQVDARDADITLERSSHHTPSDLISTDPVSDSECAVVGRSHGGPGRSLARRTTQFAVAATNPGAHRSDNMRSDEMR